MFDFLRPHESLLSWAVFGLVLIGLTISVSNAFLDTTVWQLEAQRSLSTPIEKPQSVRSVADTSNWKTYRNGEYGFALSYPANWKLTEYSSGTSIILDPPNNPGIAKTYFGLSIENKTLGTIREAMPKEVVREEIVVAGRASDKYIYDPSRVSIYVPFDDRVGVYHIDLYTPPGVDEPNQILSTFRFSEPLDTSTWKTYRNAKYGFEFKYPPNLRGGGDDEQFSGAYPGSQSVNLLVRIVPKESFAVLYPHEETLSIRRRSIGGVSAEEYYDTNARFIYIPLPTTEQFRVEIYAEVGFWDTDQNLEGVISTFQFVK